MSADTEEKTTPPVPPSEHVRARELDDKGSRVLETDALETTCPGCGGQLYYEEVATGKTMIAIWEYDEWDSDEYKLSKTYERTERYNYCGRCGWRVEV